MEKGTHQSLLHKNGAYRALSSRQLNFSQVEMDQNLVVEQSPQVVQLDNSATTEKEKEEAEQLLPKVASPKSPKKTKNRKPKKKVETNDTDEIDI